MALASSGGYCARSSSGVLFSISSFVGSGRKMRPEEKEMRFEEKSESSGLEMVEDEPLEPDFRCLGVRVAGSAVAGVGSGVGDLGGEVALGVMVEVEMGGGG